MHHIDSAYILAGGRSSRFGKNKAMVPIDGLPLIQKLFKELCASGLAVTLVAQSELDYSEFGIPTIADGVDKAGPLAGIVAALEHSSRARKEFCLILSCDLIEWQDVWLSTFLEGQTTTPDAAVVIFDGEPFQPFPGLYRTELYGWARETLASGIVSIRGFFDSIHGPICRCPVPNEGGPMGFNTPEELAMLLGDKSS